MPRPADTPETPSPGVRRVTTSCSLSAPDEPMATIVEAVAASHGVSPLECPDEMHRVVDPDALNGLFTGTPSETGFLEFTFGQRLIRVAADGTVTVTGHSE